ncbi:MAG: ATP synthase subunit I [Candidatus Binataceae bacterium]
MRARPMPAIPAIQRTTAVIAALAAAALAGFDSRAAGIGCLVGAAVVIANLWVLSKIGRSIVAVSRAKVSGAAAKLWVLAVPFKLLVLVGAVYLIFIYAKIDAIGFGAGVLTQAAAVIIETGRASLRGAPRAAR